MSNETASKNEYLVEVKNLQQYFPIKVGLFKSLPLKAVDGVSFSIKPGETLGLVGESGCGKTTVGRSLLRLYTPTGGDVFFDGEKVDEKSIGHMRKQMQMVFQDPYSSLNPRMTVEDIIGEPLDVHKLYQSKGERRDKILHLMELVGLNAEHATRYAHEFSGGQRQRIGIARALATNPRFIVCDEAVSALDVSIQAQVINMFEELQEKLGVAYLFIAHDLLVVHHISDRIAVMYAGDIIEVGDVNEIFYQPCHPYTWALLSSLPQLGIKGEDLYSIAGTPPNLQMEIKGDAFAPRNPYALKIDYLERPPFFDVSPTHKVRTWLKDPRAPQVEPPETVNRLGEGRL